MELKNGFRWKDEVDAGGVCALLSDALDFLLAADDGLADKAMGLKRRAAGIRTCVREASNGLCAAMAMLVEVEH